MSRRSLPYKLPSDTLIQAGEWTLLLDGDEISLPEALPYWDYQMDLKLRRHVRLDADKIRAETGLPPSAALSLTVVWTATGSNLRAPAEQHLIRDAGTDEAELAANLRGTDLGGLLVLETAVVLAESCKNAGPTAPRRAGSVLWSDRQTLRLQGDAPLFPMSVIDFAKTSYPNDAGWHLHIGGNLNAAAMGAVLLLVNERNEVVATAFRNAAKPRPVDRVVLSAVYSDVARTMIEHALSKEDFADDRNFPDDSLGEVLIALFNQLFPGYSINRMRLRLNESPALFASDIQAAVRIFEAP